jgi:hypothetical protein
MMSHLFWRGREALFQISDQWWLGSLSTLNWRIVVPAVLVGNIVMSICAWFLVELLMKLV